MQDVGSIVCVCVSQYLHPLDLLHQQPLPLPFRVELRLRLWSKAVCYWTESRPAYRCLLSYYLLYAPL